MRIITHIRKTALLAIIVISAFIFVECKKPSTACFTMSSSQVYVGQSITFTSCSKCEKCSNHNTVSDLQWDFGDGTTGSGASVDHTYNTAGQYNVTLTSNDADKDAKGTITQMVTVVKYSDLSRSGKFIAFTSDQDGDYDIYLAQVDASGNLASSGLVFGSNPYNLTNSFNALSDREPNWSPDGKALVFSSKRPTGEINIFAFFFNSDGSLVSATPSVVIQKAAAWDENASFSPDGKNIVFDRRVDQDANGLDSTDNRDLYFASITLSAGSIALNGTTQITSTSNIDEGNPKWSPLISVGRVAYERPPTPTAGDHDIYIIDPFNPANNIVYNNPGSSGYPAWAPDCTSITFESNSGNGGFYKIVNASYPTNAGASDVAQSSSQNFRYPTRLPNGSMVAYIQISPVNQKGNIYVVSVTGGTSSKLLPASFDNANNIFPAW
jgi:Tol biopolymer transport system component